jgi:asparagine synthase (glutamine-hydrolysing)
MRPSFIHTPRDASFFGLHERLWELGSGPARYVTNALWLYPLRARAGADGVTTLLTGSRGNLQFSADGPDWVASLVRSGRFAPAGRELASWARVSGESLATTVRRQLVYPLLPGALQRLARAVRGRPGLIDEWAAATALRPEIAAALDLGERVPMLGKRRPDLRAAGVWTTRLTAEHAETESALASLTGVDERDPTGDRRVLEAAMRQPEWVRRHDGITRAVARGAMADRLPAAITNRTKIGEQLPEWLDVMTAARAELIEELRELKHHPTSRELIDANRLERLLDHWPNRTAYVDRRVEADYRGALSRALLLSKYLRWFEERAARAS